MHGLDESTVVGSAEDFGQLCYQAVIPTSGVLVVSYEANNGLHVLVGQLADVYTCLPT